MRYPRGRRLAGRPRASRAVARRHGEGRWVCGASGLSWTCPRQGPGRRGVLQHVAHASGFGCHPHDWQGRRPMVGPRREGAVGPAQLLRHGTRTADGRAGLTDQPEAGLHCLVRVQDDCATASLLQSSGEREAEGPARPCGVGPHAAADASGAARAASRPARAVSGRGTEGA